MLKVHQLKKNVTEDALFTFSSQLFPPQNLGDVSDENRERFYQDIKSDGKLVSRKI